MLKLKLQCFGHLMQRADSLEKTLIMGKIEGRRGRDDRGQDGWMAFSPLDQGPDLFLRSTMGHAEEKRL